ncbi:MAG: hypothetical protein H0V50_02750 [Thermoleophilaceae bacterium]|nr:hypothetical protein [Thermoleophilaceae bacterium]
MADKDTKRDADESIASDADNRKLKHTEGGVTTRDDALDAGVPMLPGSPDEPQGPEDALGIGSKRGDYTGRIGPDSYQPHQSVPIPASEQTAGGPTARLEAQAPRALDIGDEAGVKGGTQLATGTPRPSPR